MGSRFLLFGGYSDESATTSDLYELSLPQSDGVGSHDGGKVIDAVWDPSQLVQMRQKNEVDHVNDDGRDSANTFPQSRQGHAALRHDKELIIIGGCQMQNNRKVACFSDAWAFHSEKKKWRRMMQPAASSSEQSSGPDQVGNLYGRRGIQSFSLFSPREGLSASFISGGRILIYGGCDDVTSANICYADVSIIDTYEPCGGVDGNCGGRGDC